MKKLITASLLTFACSASIANANLITNGSFEDNHVNYGKWNWFTADNVNGWNGSNIEIWNHLQGEAAFDGQQFAELNSHGRSSTGYSIFQEFNTVAGQTYDLSFAYQARVNSANEVFSASIFDINGLIKEWIQDDHTTSGWSVMSDSFVARDDVTRLQFTAITPQFHTYGNFIDDIRVVTQVDEPASLALLGLGIAGLIATRRKLKS